MSSVQAEGLVKRFWRLPATDRLRTLAVEAWGDPCAGIGPNGAGKSTLVNLISGSCCRRTPAYRARRRRAHRAGAARARTCAGLRCFQITSVFRNDSGNDNLLLAVQAQAGSSLLPCRGVTPSLRCRNALRRWRSAPALTEVLPDA